MAGAAFSRLCRSGAALVCAWLFLLSAAPCLASNTQTPMTLSQISARAVAAKYGRADPGWRDLSRNIHSGWAVGAPATGSVVVSGTLKGPSPLVGEVIDVTIKRNVPWASIARGVAKGLPAIGTAVALMEIADAIRCREALGGGAECDLGTDQTLQPTWCTNSNGTGSCAMSPAAAASPTLTASTQLWKDGWGTLPPGWSFVSGPLGPECVVVSAAQQVCHGQQWRVLQPGGSQAGSNRPNVTVWLVDALQCPASIDFSNPANNVPAGLPPGADGKCKTGRYAGQSEDQVTDRVINHGDKGKAGGIAGALSGAGIPMDHPFPEVLPPATVTGPRETTVHPDGSITTRDPSWELTPTPDGYAWTPRVTIKDWAPGVTPSPPGEVDGGTTTSGGSAPERDIITCGLPDTPACKIDETGTPTAPADDSATRAQGYIQGITNCVLTPSSCLPALPSLNWGFSLPTACQPIPVAAFSAYGLDEIDLCPFQPMIHDIMSMIWAAGGLFTAVGMMFRGTE